MVTNCGLANVLDCAPSDTCLCMSRPVSEELVGEKQPGSNSNSAGGNEPPISSRVHDSSSQPNPSALESKILALAETVTQARRRREIDAKLFFGTFSKDVRSCFRSAARTRRGDEPLQQSRRSDRHSKTRSKKCYSKPNESSTGLSKAITTKLSFCLMCRAHPWSSYQAPPNWCRAGNPKETHRLAAYRAAADATRK